MEYQNMIVFHASKLSSCILVCACHHVRLDIMPTVSQEHALFVLSLALFVSPSLIVLNASQTTHFPTLNSAYRTQLLCVIYQTALLAHSRTHLCVSNV